MSLSLEPVGPSTEEVPVVEETAEAVVEETAEAVAEETTEAVAEETTEAVDGTEPEPVKKNGDDQSNSETSSKGSGT